MIREDGLLIWGGAQLKQLILAMVVVGVSSARVMSDYRYQSRTCYNLIEQAGHNACVFIDYGSTHIEIVNEMFNIDALGTALRSAALATTCERSGLLDIGYHFCFVEFKDLAYRVNLSRVIDALVLASDDCTPSEFATSLLSYMSMYSPQNGYEQYTSNPSKGLSSDDPIGRGWARDSVFASPRYFLISASEYLRGESVSSLCVQPLNPIETDEEYLAVGILITYPVSAENTGLLRLSGYEARLEHNGQYVDCIQNMVVMDDLHNVEIYPGEAAIGYLIFEVPSEWIDSRISFLESPLLVVGRGFPTDSGGVFFRIVADMGL